MSEKKHLVKCAFNDAMRAVQTRWSAVQSTCLACIEVKEVNASWEVVAKLPDSIVVEGVVNLSRDGRYSAMIKNIISPISTACINAYHTGCLERSTNAS